MTQTGESLLNYFREKSKAKGKMFFEGPDDRRNADGLMTYFQTNYDETLLYKCVDKYIELEQEMATTLSKFVVGMGKTLRGLLAAQAERDRFNKLMKETRNRMEGESN